MPTIRPPDQSVNGQPPRTWCEWCGNTTKDSLLSCSLDCAETLLKDAFARKANDIEITRYERRRDRWRRRAGVSHANRLMRRMLGVST